MTGVASPLTLGQVGRDKVSFGGERNVRCYPTSDEWNSVKNVVLQSSQAVGASVAPAEGTVSEVLSRGLIDAHRAQRWLVRDDFVPGATDGPTYTVDSGTFTANARAVSDAEREGFGVLTLSATDQARQVSPILCAGGTGLIVRARLLVSSTAAIGNATAFVGLLNATGTFGAVVGVVSSTLFAQVFSVAGGGSLPLIGPAAVSGRWHSLGLSVTADGIGKLFVDSVEVAAGANASAVPTAAEEMGLGMIVDSASGTTTLSLDALEAEGPRR